ncbi:Hypp4095 [Branchiostoma lanceolatum]|uniref:Hypp4095 protein n=1 Tax=Branchiostoma lanceolatum TaxID=7740 RepID=A0A8K0AA60_BRALA|nr:Hypp4095 [Branchiostoma lanceolatum]
MDREIMQTRNKSGFHQLVEVYNMQKHPEGGWYKETFRSSVHFRTEDGTESTAATVCYYLLPEVVRSTWRRLTSDEIWLYQDGGCLKIHMIDANGIYSTAVLGSTIRHKEARYEVLVPAGVWGAAEVLHGGEFTLISCVVAPGFDWKGLELGQEEELVTSFPHLADVIKYFCKH